MRLIRKISLVLLLICLLAGGCSGTETTPPDAAPVKSEPAAVSPTEPEAAPQSEPASSEDGEEPEDDEEQGSFFPGLFKRKTETSDCGEGPFFTALPVDIEGIDEIVTLGNMSPPSHIFPTDHIYFYPTRQENADRPDTVDIYSPGDLTVTHIWASEHVKAGFADYNIFLEPCEDITVMFYHVSVPDSDLFGDASNFADWHLDSEYDTGGETYRIWSKNLNIEVKAGDRLGLAGGNPGQWAFDLGVYDERHRLETVASPERWEQYRYLNAVCPLSLYEPGPVLDRLVSLVKRDRVEGEALPCGSVLQDVPGTAQGCWFLSGIKETYPEDPHLALVHSNFHPARAVFSVGNSIPNLPGGLYEFLPEVQGVLNRDFSNITPDGRVYGFQVEYFNGIILIEMPDAETLYIEALPGATDRPDSWVFTEGKTTFKR